MPKFCMPTFGNEWNNTKTACIFLYRIQFPTWIGKPGAIFSAEVNIRQTSHAGIPPDCVRLAEKLALVAFRLFPRPLWFRGWVGLWGFLWWAPSAKGKDHHRVSSGWSSVWHRSNTGLSSTQYEQIPIILGVWPFWLTPLFFWSVTFWRAYG